MSKNVFNPENIVAGDFVSLKNENGKLMEVISVGGKSNNKIYCHEIGHELYANLFDKKQQ
jgi:hypothetical protein